MLFRNCAVQLREIKYKKIKAQDRILSKVEKEWRLGINLTATKNISWGRSKCADAANVQM
jgi:hypothetical protein